MRRLKYSAALICFATLTACQMPTPESSSSEVDVAPAAETKTSSKAPLFDLAASEPKFELIEDQAAAQIHSSGSDSALDISFQVIEGLSKASLIPQTPFDWAHLQDTNIAFDIANPSDVSTQIYVSIVDASGRFQNRSASIPANSTGTYFFFIDGPTRDIDGGVRELPDPWLDDDETMMIWRWGARGEGEFDWSSITEVGFFVRGAIREKSARVANIRLRDNAPIPSDYLQGISDRFGQNAKLDFPIKVQSEAALRAAAQAELAELEAKPGFPDRSRFGGWKDGPRLDATGYFRTAKVDDKWWLVDPDGHLFFSHGVANVRMANSTTITGIDFADETVRIVSDDEVTPEDSIGIVKVSDAVRETEFVSSALRHDMFEWLPEYSDALADHYSYRRSVHEGPVESGETFSFYRANLERRYGESTPQSYLQDWRQVTLDRMKSWGFTSFGNWVDPTFYTNEQVPYFANGWIIGDFQTLSSGEDVWAPMPDFFDPVFKERARATISVVAEEVQGSPWCVGIFIDNEKSWGFRDGSVSERYGIVLDALSRAAEDSPAKAAFSNLLEEKYGEIEHLNLAWRTDFESWQEVRQGQTFEAFSTEMEQDISLMLEALAEEYFKTVDATLEEYLPEHLYMGARMASWGMPDEVVKAALKYSDVMSFNIYTEGLQDDAWSFFVDIDKPVIIGEFHVGAISDTGLFHPGLVMASDQADRARMYVEYMDTVTSNPYLVGAHWFQYTDSPLTGRAFDGENYNVGFVNIADIPYPEMVDAARSIMKDLYPDRFNGVAED